MYCYVKADKDVAAEIAAAKAEVALKFKVMPGIKTMYLDTGGSVLSAYVWQSG
jgi:hypothetical protein